MKKILFILVFSLLLSGCKEAKTEEITTPKDNQISVTTEQFKSGSMEIATPSQQNFDVVVKAAGKIDVPPKNRAQISSFMGGYVKTTSLLIGDKVSKGQALITLESTEYLDIQKEYLDVAKQIAYLKSEYERQKTLFDEKITSQKNYLKAESDYQRTKGMFQSLAAKLRLLNINPAEVEKGHLTSVITLYAPIAGDIVVMNASVGMHVAPSDIIMGIVKTSDLHLELDVFEKDILSVKPGQKITFIAPEASKEVFNAEVHLVGKSIEGTERTINVHGHLDEKIKQKLITGMFVEGSIIVASKKGLAVPKDALINEKNKSFLLLLTENKDNSYFFKKVAVTIGSQSENFVEILADSQINSASKILTKGVFDVAN